MIFRLHMARSTIALFMVGFLSLFIAFWTGVVGCWKRSPGNITATAILMLVTCKSFKSIVFIQSIFVFPLKFQAKYKQQIEFSLWIKKKHSTRHYKVLLWLTWMTFTLGNYLHIIYYFVSMIGKRDRSVLWLLFTGL